MVNKQNDDATVNWIYADLAGVVFRYNRSTNTVQRLFIHTRGWETRPTSAMGSRIDTIAKAIEEQQDYTKSEFYMATGRKQSLSVDTTGFIYAKPGVYDAYSANPKLDGQGLTVRQVRALSKLPQPINVLGGMRYEDRQVFVVVKSGKVYEVNANGLVSPWH